MSAFKNDGTVQYGSIVLAIGDWTGGTPPTIGTPTNYIADNFTVNRPSKTIERTSEIDEPNGQVSYAGFVTGSATLQLASGSTAVPVQGEAFTATVGAAAEYFYIDSVDQPLDKAGEKKVNITFRKVIVTTA